MTARICFVAAPLTARSGVYRSARETVTEARSHGDPWSLVLGVSASAGGSAPTDDPDWIDEMVREPGGVGGVRSLARALSAHALVRGSDLVISLNPQSDMALALTGLPWVAYLRGLPWPGAGEGGRARAVLWRALERAALSRARETWATTPFLARDVGEQIVHRIVPPGVRPVPRSWDGRAPRTRAVWAARFDRDKNPDLFLAAMAGQSFTGVMYGSGPVLDSVEANAPENVRIGSWVDPDALWVDAFAYVGTSTREAFGRSAVEAAMNGVPVVLSKAFGAAEFLYSDPDLRSRFVLDVGDPLAWRRALAELHDDRGLRAAVSDHVATNAAALSIAASAAAIRSAVRPLMGG